MYVVDTTYSSCTKSINTKGRSTTKKGRRWRTAINAMFLCYSMSKLRFCSLRPIYWHYVFWSVRLFVRCTVRPYVRLPLQVKVVGRGRFWWSWSPINLTLRTHVPYDLSNVYAILEFFEFLPYFHGPLNIENDSADRASVY